MGGDVAADLSLGGVFRGGVAEGLAAGDTMGECGSSLSLSPPPCVDDDPLLPQGDLLGVSDLV